MAKSGTFLDGDPKQRCYDLSLTVPFHYRAAKPYMSAIKPQAAFDPSKLKSIRDVTLPFGTGSPDSAWQS